MSRPHSVSFHFNKKTKEWHWTKRAGNGRIVLGSTEGYKNRRDCWENFVAESLTGWIIVDEAENLDDAPKKNPS